MKIVYLITKSSLGGAQRYVFDLATAAQNAQHDVLVGFGGDGPLGEKLRAHGVRTLSIPELGRDINLRSDIRAFFAILRLLSQERPHVLHLNSSKIGALGGVAGRVHNSIERLRHLFSKNGIPTRIIFTGHGWAFNEERSDLERTIIGIIHWITIMCAHRTIAVSRTTRDQIGKLPFSWHRLTVIYNGDGPIRSLPQDEARKDLLRDTPYNESGLPPGTFLLGTIAELHRNKGLNYALEGLAQLQKQGLTSTIFLVIGEGEERSQLEAQRDMLGLHDQVLFVGTRSFAARFLTALDAFLLPSITEAFPYAILEAGKIGLPIIATNVGGIPEVIDDMESGILIHSKNSGEIARSIKFLIENPDRRIVFGEGIKKRIADRFNIETMVAETLALYAQTSNTKESTD